ncbi:hypothetical protein DFH08DRAFT_800107 [Mycena albidolilacea]|uniref:Uncharacterized protein n=1 Tax=Mycena albidolilacea TaxID=1033008 RepID=A0AAD7AJ93_9AGAR|nr:hypothetical protein DFH08DRAFT_800107 [Mycena albidolilacea]
MAGVRMRPKDAACKQLRWPFGDHATAEELICARVCKRRRTNGERHSSRLALALLSGSGFVLLAPIVVAVWVRSHRIRNRSPSLSAFAFGFVTASASAPNPHRHPRMSVRRPHENRSWGVGVTCLATARGGRADPQQEVHGCLGERACVPAAEAPDDHWLMEERRREGGKGTQGALSVRAEAVADGRNACTTRILGGSG